MSAELAFGAAVGCAVCNAAAAILQKVSSNKVTTLKSYNVGIFLHLLKQLPYIAGILFDLLAGLLTLVAVKTLPLFVVQSVIASCVVMTAILEHVFLKRQLKLQTYIASIVVLIGLGCLALASHSEQTAIVSQLIKLLILLTPVMLIAIGAISIRYNNRLSAALLAILSGAAFGGVSVIGRLFVYPDPIWLVIKAPLFWAIIVYGILGMVFFTAALQRTLATAVNGVMTSAQTVIPIIIGITLLGDTARSGLWLVMWIGGLFVVGGCSFIAFNARAGERTYNSENK